LRIGDDTKWWNVGAESSLRRESPHFGLLIKGWDHSIQGFKANLLFRKKVNWGLLGAAIFHFHSDLAFQELLIGIVKEFCAAIYARKEFWAKTSELGRNPLWEFYWRKVGPEGTVFKLGSKGRWSFILDSSSFLLRWE